MKYSLNKYDNLKAVKVQKKRKGQNSLFPFNQQLHLFKNEKIWTTISSNSLNNVCNIRYRVINYVNKSVYIQYMVYTAIHTAD